MLLSCAEDDSSGPRGLQFGDVGAFASPFAKRGRFKRELPGAMVRFNVVQAVAIRENMTLRSRKSQEDLTGCRFTARALHDLELPFLDEVVVLHHSVNAFDAARNIDEARL